MRPQDRHHHCRTCRGSTRQRFLFSQNGNHPEIEHWQCARCGATFLTLGDVLDAEGLCLNVLRQFTHGHDATVRDGGDKLDAADVTAHLLEHLWRAWLAYDPARCLRFRAFVTVVLRQRLADLIRDEFRFGKKPLTNAVSFHAIDGHRPSRDGSFLGDAEHGGNDGGLYPRGHPVEQALGERAVDDPEHSLVPDTGCAVDLERELDKRSGELAEHERGLSRRVSKVGLGAAPRSPSRTRSAQ